MAAELLTDASRATDANSNPYAGATWNFYAAGTLTPQSVYADAALNTSLGAVVTADAGGKFVSIYFDSSKSYRGVLRSAGGAVTVHDIDPINAGVLSDLGSSAEGKGAALIDATRRDVDGPMIRTQQDRNERDQIPLLDFCSGDEAQDASPGIAKAVEKVLEYDADLFIPSGTYRLTDTFEIGMTLRDFRSFNMRGMGNGSVFEWDGGNNKPMIHMRGYGSGAAGWYSKNRFEHFRLRANSYTGSIDGVPYDAPFSGVTGIQLGDTPELVTSGICNPALIGLTIQHTTTAIHGLYESDQVMILDCYIDRFEQYGIYNEHGGSNWTMMGNHVSDGLAAATAIRSSLAGTRLIANTIQGQEYAVAIQIDGGAVNQGQAPYIVGNYIECQLDHSYAIALYGVLGGLIEGNIFKGCRGATLILLADGPGAMKCRNIELGTNQHTVSGGNLNRFAYCAPGSIDCTITGQMDSVAADGTPGIYSTAKIEGSFISVLQDGGMSLTDVLKIDANQVVGPRGAAVADAAALTSVNGTNAVGVPTNAEFNALVAEFNKLRTDVGAVRTTLNTSLARDRAHGLIAP